MRIILVAALATMMCAPAGLAQTTKEKPPQATASSQRQLSPAERVRGRDGHPARSHHAADTAGRAVAKERPMMSTPPDVAFARPLSGRQG